MLERRAEEEHAANLRAGLIAATIINVKRRKGTRAVKPADFFRGPREHLTREQAVAFLDGWAARQNRAAARNANQGSSRARR